MIPADEALQRLRDGNARFVAGDIDPDSLEYHAQRQELVGGQNPFAVILGCSDSRVPVEIIFDQGLGDLFVIRVAGNIVARSQIGSIEFAAQSFGARLVVVLGHTQCGAVAATLDELRKPGEKQSKNLEFIVDSIRPAVDRAIANGYEHDPDELAEQVVRENVRCSAELIRHGSQIIEDLIDKDGLLIVGAEYSLESGKVEFF